MAETETTAELGWYKDLDDSYDKAVERVTAELKTAGFGVLTEIQVDEKLKEKIGVDFPRYVILGACNPPLAHQALEQNRDVGLLMPCNVTVEETDTGARVGIVRPVELLKRYEDNTTLCALAEAAEEQLQEAFNRL